MINECLQIIANKGLEGLKFDEFLEILGYNDVWGSNVQCTTFKTKLWKFLIQSEKISFYNPLSALPTETTKVYDKPQNVVDDVTDNLRGYCRNYDKITKISKSKLNLFDDPSKRYPELHIQAAQHLREDNFVRDTNDFIVSELGSCQYAVYEYLRRVGKYGLTSRQLIEAFNCKSSQIVFYLEFLERVAAIKVQFNSKQLNERNRGIKRENFFFHREHQDSIECVIGLINKMMTFMNEHKNYSENDISNLFKISLYDTKLVDAVDETYKLVKYFLVKLGVLVQQDNKTSPYKMNLLVKQGLVMVNMVPYSQNIPKSGGYYADLLLLDEPMDLQILRAIEKKGKKGLSSSEGPSMFGLHSLLFRLIINSLIRKKQIGSVSTLSGKTNLFNYVSSKYLSSSKISSTEVEQKYDANEQDIDNKRKFDTSNSKFLPHNVYRAKIIIDIFEKHKTLTRPEVRKYLIKDSRHEDLPLPDSKTMKRLMSTLVNQGKLILLTICGNGKDPQQIEMYHVPDCNTEDLKEKVRLHKSRLDADIMYDDSLEATAYSFITSLRQFPNPIPDEIADSDMPYEAVGIFYGPKTAFFQQLHFMLSILTYRWEIPTVIPNQYVHLHNWWSYILTEVEPMEAQKDGSYEVKDILYYLPVQFMLKNILAGRVYEGFGKLMNSEEYRCHCIGQLPVTLKISLSKHIMNIVNATTKCIEPLVIMGLVEFKCEIEYTKRDIANFRIKLIPNVLLLNTMNAPFNNVKFRGFNLRRIINNKIIIVYDTSNWIEYNTYWDNAKELCLYSNIKDKRSIFSEIRLVPQTLLQVLTENGIPTDQTEEFYEQPGTMEKLKSIYSELGPAGFHLGLIFHKKLAWVDKVNLKDCGLKGFRPDLLSTNCLRNYKNSKKFDLQRVHDSSDSDDYMEKPKYVPKKKKKRKRNSIVISSSLEKKLIQKSKNKKRKLSLGEQKKPKRIKVKFRDDFDKQVSKSKVHERVNYTGEEDEWIILYLVCVTVSKIPIETVKMRDYLHKMCPTLSADKTAESVRKRMNLLKRKPGVVSIMADLQSKCMVYRDIYFPQDCCCEKLLKTAKFWSGKSFIVRSILPASLIDFKNNYDIEVAGAKGFDTLILFFPDGYRVRRVPFISIGNVKSFWDYDTTTEEEKLIYQYVQISLSTEKGDYVTQEAAFKVFQGLDKNIVENVYNFACQHNILRRQKKTMVNGKIHRERMAMSNEVLQCFYNPYPQEIFSANPVDTLFEVEYHKINAQVVSGVIHMMGNPSINIIVSGAIDPLIEKKQYMALLKDTQEDDIYSQKHTKKNTFFSGIRSIEEGKQLGFYVTEKQILGRPESKMNFSISSDRLDAVSIEETLGLTEAMNVLPLKIFVSSNNCQQSFGWNRLDLNTGKASTENCLINTESTATELPLCQLYEASSKNLMLPGGESGQITVFENFCKLQSDCLNAYIGKALIHEVFKSKYKGVPENTLLTLWSSKYGIEISDVEKLVHVCVGLEIFVKVGLKEIIIIGKQYSERWHIMLKSVVLNKMDDPEPLLSTTNLQENFETFFPLPVRPWRTMNSDFNLPLLKKMFGSVALLIYTYPGISKQLIDEHYHAYLTPLASTELLEALLFGNVIKRCMDLPHSVSLFSSPLPVPRLERFITNASCFMVQIDGLQKLENFI